jgi:deoxyribonuclease-1
MRKKTTRFLLALLVLASFYPLARVTGLLPLPTGKGKRHAPQSLSLGPHSIQNFEAAKKIAALLYEEHPYTFYCGCHFVGKWVDHEACGYRPIHNTQRAHRLEWEHIVPAHAFGQHFASWKKGDSACHHTNGTSFKGRACARLTSNTFSTMEGDLYNLVPAIGEVNQLRSDFPVGLLPGVSPIFGKCTTKIAHGVIEPRVEVRGFVARTYRYMDDRYPGFGILSEGNRSLLLDWDARYPPDAFEKARAKKIARIQGNPNRFVEKSP